MSTYSDGEIAAIGDFVINRNYDGTRETIGMVVNLKEDSHVLNCTVAYSFDYIPTGYFIPKKVSYTNTKSLVKVHDYLKNLIPEVVHFNEVREI